ncbi:MAG: GNAT family N-acetyltransferase [Flavobacteriales bacterium]|nr:GNAT family N-acetyltransferase [Flavobacteriales bacterium]
MIKLPIPSMHGFTTERLRFRHISLNDVDLWMPYINSAEAIRFMTFTQGSRTDCEFMLRRSVERYVDDGSGLNMLELRSTGEAVGQCGLLTQLVDGVPELEIGYHLLPAHWHQGYATEAAQACKAFAFEHQQAPSLISLIDPDNFPSQHVARRNGMVAERTVLFRDRPAIVHRIAAPLT